MFKKFLKAVAMMVVMVITLSCVAISMGEELVQAEAPAEVVVVEQVVIEVSAPVMVKVAFVINGAKKDVEIEKGQVVQKPADPSLEGSKFLYWLNKEANKEHDFKNVINADTTLVACFEVLPVIEEVKEEVVIEEKVEETKNEEATEEVTEEQTEVEEIVEEVVAEETTEEIVEEVAAEETTEEIVEEVAADEAVEEVVEEAAVEDATEEIAEEGSVEEEIEEELEEEFTLTMEEEKVVEVNVVVIHEGGKIHIGDKVILVAQTEEDVQFQWQFSVDDGATWNDINGANGKTMDFVVSNENANNMWRVKILY